MDVGDFENWLHSRGVPKECPYCGSEPPQWDVAFALIQRADDEGNPRLPLSEKTHAVTLTCANCGGLRFFRPDYLVKPRF